MSNSSVLVMPTFNLLPGTTLAALLFLVAALVEVVNEEGEYVLSQIAEKKEATNLLSEDIVMIPLAIAAGVPQHIVTYGTCANFYGPVSIFVSIFPSTIGDRLASGIVTMSSDNRLVASFFSAI